MAENKIKSWHKKLVKQKKNFIINKVKRTKWLDRPTVKIANRKYKENQKQEESEG